MCAGASLLVTQPAAALNENITGSGNLIENGDGGNVGIGGNFYINTTGNVVLEGDTSASSASIYFGYTGISGGFGVASGSGVATFTVVSSVVNVQNAGSLLLATNSNGTMSFSEASQLNLNNVPTTIGYLNGSGTLTLDGNSALNSEATLDVGSGAQSIGILTLSNGSTATIAGPTTIAANAGSFGTINIGAAEGSSPTPVPSGVLNDASIVFGAGTGLIEFNYTGAVTFPGAITGGAGGDDSVVQLDSGNTTFTGTGSSYTGTMNISAGTAAIAGANNVFSANAAVNVAAGSTSSTGGTLNLNGSSSQLQQETGTLSNSGLINFDAAAAAGTTLTVNGNYSGTSGTINMGGTINGGTGAPADTLVVDGTTSGTTIISYTGSGTGGATSGEGILVVQSQSTSADAFKLVKPVVVGDTTYTLVQGTTDPGNWYLQATGGSTRAGGAGTVTPVPTMSDFALALLALLVAGGAALKVRRRN